MGTRTYAELKSMNGATTASWAKGSKRAEEETQQQQQQQQQPSI